MKIKPITKFEFEKREEYVFSYVLYRKFKKSVENNITDAEAKKLNGTIISYNHKTNIQPEFCYLKGNKEMENLEKVCEKQARRFELLKL